MGASESIKRIRRNADKEEQEDSNEIETQFEDVARLVTHTRQLSEECDI